MRTDHPIAKLCAILQVSASGYYDWAKRPSTPALRAAEDLDLAREIAVIHAESRQTYGGPRVRAVLRSRGRHHGRKRIARLMKGQDLRGRQRRRYRVQTTDSNHGHPIATRTLPRPAPPTRSGSPTSPMFRPFRAGFISPAFSTSTAAGSSAGP